VSVQAPAPGAPEVAAALERAYARPEFAPPAPGLLDPVRDALGRLWERITELFGRWGGLLGDGSLVDRLVVGALLVVAAIVVGYLLHETVGRLRGRGPAARTGGDAGEGAGARARSAPGWEALAGRLAGEGRYREAALALYQAFLLRLEEDGALRYDPAGTPGDYLRQTRTHPAGRRLAAFLRGFEPVAFGGRTLAAEGYERLRSATAEGDRVPA
jgi:hypothetical protein